VCSTRNPVYLRSATGDLLVIFLGIELTAREIPAGLDGVSRGDVSSLPFATRI
jgi:hypothetical protein